MSVSSGHPILSLKADGGAAANDLLLQIQADHLQVPVSRPVVAETTALGAAYLAGLAEGVWGSTDDITSNWQLDATFDPAMDPADADALHERWCAAVARDRGWAPSRRTASGWPKGAPGGRPCACARRGGGCTFPRGLPRDVARVTGSAGHN